MTDKVTLTNLANLQNETTAVNAINANNAAITTAMDNTLSRDGTSPNQMGASLDMNSNQIINLPAPATATSALRYQDLVTFVGGGTVTNIPAGGNQGQSLTKHSNTDFDVQWGGDSVFNSKLYVGSGSLANQSTSVYQFLVNSATSTGNLLQMQRGISGSLYALTASSTVLQLQTLLDTSVTGWTGTGLSLDVQASAGTGGAAVGINVNAQNNGTWTAGGALTGASGINTNAQSSRGGNLWGGNFIATASTVAANTIQGIEVDVVNSIASTGTSRGLYLVDKSSVAATNGYAIHVTATSTAPWATALINLDAAGGSFPLASSGVLFVTSTATINTGFDLSHLTFSSNRWVVTLNNQKVCSYNAAGSVIQDLLYLDGSNVLNLYNGTFKIDSSGNVNTGIWQGTVVSPTYGGTGINNSTRTLTINTNSGTLAFSGASKTLTIANSGTLSGGDGFTLSIAANKTLTANNNLTLAGVDGKTLTINNSLTLAGTDSTTMTFPGASDTVAGLGTAQTFTKQNIFNVASTIASAASAPIDNLKVSAATQTYSGSTNVTTAVGVSSFYIPTITASAAAIVISNLATLYVDGPPTTSASGGFTPTITKPWSFLVKAGGIGIEPATAPASSLVGAAGSQMYFGGSGSQDLFFQISDHTNAGHLEFVTNGSTQFIAYSGVLQFYQGAVKIQISNAGGLSVGTTTDPGVGSILANAFVKSQSASAGVGYATGAGGTISQGTNRTTAVTLNKICGQITMFSAAGSATPASFVVNNTSVAATDTVQLSIASGATNVYNLSVSAISGGTSFTITFFTTGGTATDAPVINFTIIKGVTS